MRKTFIATILVLVLVLASLTGCVTKTTEPTQAAEATTQAAETTAAPTTPAEKVEIQLLHGQPEEPRVKAIQSIIDDFMAQNPDIIVTQLPTPEDGYWTKISTLISSGQLPAVVEGGVDQLRMIHAEEALDISANTAAIDLAGKDRFFEGVLEMAKAPGGEGYLGIPVSGFVSGIWYRKSMFEAKGLAAPDSWENILAAAKALNDPANKMYGIIFPTEESDFTEQVFTGFANSNDVLLFDDAGQPQFMKENMKEALSFYKDLYAYTMPGSNGVEQVKDAFVGGHSAMATYSTYIMGALYEQGLADDVGFTVPKKALDGSFGMTSTMGISNMITPEEREAAIKFTAFMMSKKANITWCHMSAGGSNPVLKDVASDPDYLDHELLTAFGETASKVPEAFKSLRMLGFQNGEPHPAMGSITAKFIIPRCINQVLVQGKDLDKQMTIAQAELEAEVAAN